MNIWEALVQHYDLSEVEEVSFEANPDDLSEEYLTQLRKTPIQRLSIGVQSFQDEDLRLMNRAHNAHEAESGIKRAQDAGFVNLSCDLIFGMPTLTDEMLEANIDKLKSLDIPHISAYALTIEERTALYHRMKKNEFVPAPEEHYERQMMLTMQRLSTWGYVQYEISNYALPGMEAIHNSNYWKGVPYLGLGPSAHSFDGKNLRRWNVRNNALYIQSITTTGCIPYESETLTHRDLANEYIMTRLRTAWGLNTEEFKQKFDPMYFSQLEQQAKPFLDEGLIEYKGQTYYLTKKGKLLADKISAELFI